jgi:kynurenine formamidase
MRAALLVLVVVLVLALGTGLVAQTRPAPAPLEGARVLDLTWPIDEKTCHWPGEKPFSAETATTIAKDGYFSRAFAMPEHYGTHLDAPAHFEAGKPTVDEIPADRLCGEAVVIDLSESHKDVDLRGRDVERFEGAHGRIPAGAIAILRTGWSEYALKGDATGYEARSVGDGKMHFPGFSREAAKILVERGVKGIAIDTLSIDCGISEKFEVHHVIAAAGVWAVENLGDRVRDIPPRGAFVVVAPLPFRGGSGSPARVLAFVPK